jgi:GGDEF domain-containing protein
MIFLPGFITGGFLEEIRRTDEGTYLPLSVIECDINGIRLINDAFGHAEGDRLLVDTAKILTGCCGKPT